MTPGHSICIAILATNPAMFGESPVFPDSFDVIDARVAPGFTSDGQIDWPIPAILSLNEPLLPIPAPLSAVVIESLGSACARAGNVAPAVMTPAATANGRSTAEAALMKSAHAIGCGTTEERRTVCLAVGRYIISAVMHCSWVLAEVHACALISFR
jgi:hypothetical protein